MSSLSRDKLRQGIASVFHSLGHLFSSSEVQTPGAALDQGNDSGVVGPALMIERNFEILAKEYGLAKAMELKLPVDAAGEPIPWYTYPAIEYMKQFNFHNKVVFEYGCGSSTLFWGKQAGETFSVEHDPNWANQIRPLLREHQTLLLCETEEDYINSVHAIPKKIDILIVDGQWRRACAQEGIAKLNKEGIVVLDNTDWFHDVADWLRSEGFFQIDFSGFGPINNYCWTTSIFIPWDSTLQNEFRNPHPLGGIACE
jgi:hypothetical protein